MTSLGGVSLAQVGAADATRTWGVLQAPALFAENANKDGAPNEHNIFFPFTSCSFFLLFLFSGCNFESCFYLREDFA